VNTTTETGAKVWSEWIGDGWKCKRLESLGKKYSPVETEVYPPKSCNNFGKPLCRYRSLTLLCLLEWLDWRRWCNAVVEEDCSPNPYQLLRCKHLQLARNSSGRWCVHVSRARRSLSCFHIFLLFGLVVDSPQMCMSCIDVHMQCY